MFLKSCYQLGEKQRMWLNALKIAIIEQNVTKIISLMDALPSFDTKEELDSAQHLVQEALSLMKKSKKETESSMAQMRKNMAFLNSAVADKKSNFDVTY